MSHPIFEYTRWVCALRQWVQTVVRDRVMMIVYHLTLKKYLIVQYTSNNEVSFPAWWIEPWDSKEDTAKKELWEEAWLQWFESIQELPDWFFEVAFYSPKRNKNYYNKTNVVMMHTTNTIDLNAINEEEKMIQSPHRWSLQQIREWIHERRENTNYEAMDYLLSKLASIK